MLGQLDFPQYNFRILNFNFLFKEIENDIINDLHKFNLLEKGRIGSNTKLFFYHHIIFGLCESLLKNKIKEKTIIYYNNNQLGNFQLLKYFKEEDILKLLNMVFKHVKKLLPIKVFISSISFDFLTHMLQKNDGRSIELINNIRTYLDSVSLENYTFSSVKNFTKKFGLVFLNKTYFNQLKSKQLIIV